MGNGDWIRRLWEFLNLGDFSTQVARGNIDGATLWHKWGYNEDVDTGSEEVIWEPGGTKTFLTSAEALTIVSDSSADADGGTGAHGVVVYGIDANREPAIEVVLLSGLTSVDTTNTYLGVNRIALFRAGSGGVNAGKITITAKTSGHIEATIPAGGGTTQQAIFYTGPTGVSLVSDLLVNVVKLSGGATPTVTIRGWVQSFVSSAKYEVFRHTVDTSVDNYLVYSPRRGFPIGASSVLYFTAETDTANTLVKVRFSVEEFT